MNVVFINVLSESMQVKNQIETILQSYRYKDNREFFVIYFRILKNIIDRCCERNNSNFEDFMKDIEEDNKQITPEFSDFIPDPVHINLNYIS